MKKEQSDNNFDGSASYVSNVLIYYRGSNSRIVEIAKRQIGNIGGRKYWEWYSFDNRVEWCAEQSGDLNITVPRFSGVDYGMEWYKEKGNWRYSNYIPSSGDIIFFDCDYDNDPDDEGIVEKVGWNYVYTIEENSNDRCRNKKYSLGYKSILGYGINNYVLN